MHDVYFPDSRDIYKAGFKVATVPVLRMGENRKLSFYTRRGDVFGWTCAGLVVLRLFIERTRGRRKRRAA
jgi:hypothetical protein